MADEFEDQEWVKVGIAAALAKKCAADQRDLLENLAVMLENALPGEADVERKGGLFTRKTVRLIRVQFDEDLYVLEDPGKGPLRATQTHVVRGIALKTEPIPIEEWLTALSMELEERARTHADARDALAKFVG